MTRASVTLAVAFACGGLVASAGCGGLLGIEDRYFDGGTVEDAPAEAAPAGDAPPLLDAPKDAPTTDGNADAGTEASAPDAGPDASCGCTASLCTLACGQNYPNSIALDGTHVYWANGGPPLSVGTGSVMRVDNGGANLMPLVLNLTSPSGIQVPPGSFAYYSQGQNGEIDYVPVGGGAVNVFVTTQPFPFLAGDTSFLFWTASTDIETCAFGAPCLGVSAVAKSQSPGNLALDATNVFWANGSGASMTVVKCSKSGCGFSPTPLATNQLNVQLIAVDTAWVYWSSLSVNTGTIYKTAKSGGGVVTTVAVEASFSISALATDGIHVYYGTADINGQIVRVAPDASGRTVIASAQDFPVAIAVDGTSVYWGTQGTTDGSGAIRSAPK